MKPPVDKVASVWSSIQAEAKQLYAAEPMLQPWVDHVVSEREGLSGGVAAILSQHLSDAQLKPEYLLATVEEAAADDSEILMSFAEDILAVVERDPACEGHITPLLYLKGFQALCGYRVAHWLWNRSRRGVAHYFQSRVSQVFGVDIHPAAQIGRGVLIDHATGVVIGETAIVEDNVSMLHQVTLGGTGKTSGARHPIIRTGVLIGAGAKVLGRIEVGCGAKVGAGSVVLSPVPEHVTVAGVPAKVVGAAASVEPARDMDHDIPAFEGWDPSI